MPPCFSPFGIGTKAANRTIEIRRSLYLIFRTRFLHFTVNHYTLRMPPQEVAPSPVNPKLRMKRPCDPAGVLLGS
jgi:hypothetical protein